MLSKNKDIRELEIALEREKLSKWTPEKIIIETILILGFVIITFSMYFSYNLFRILNRVESIDNSSMEITSEADNASNRINKIG